MPEDSGSLPDLGCACATIRRAGRLVTQLYSREMGPEAEPTQYALLSVLKHRPGGSQAMLGRALGLDKTTMSRSLRLMEKNGWIEGAASDDRRERGYRLTPPGKQVLARATRGWTRAQRRLRTVLKTLGPGDWDAMMSVLDKIAHAALVA